MIESPNSMLGGRRECVAGEGGAGDLEALVSSLVTPPLVGGVRRIDPSDIRDLTEAEAELVGHAVASRQAEFASGRVLLRSLLGRHVEVLSRSNGAPLLPDGMVGSLAHDHRFVVALMGPATTVRSVGIDIEPLQALDDQVARLVVRSDDDVPDPLTAFIAKEAAYKAWSWLCGVMVEHHDVRVVADETRFVAIVRDELIVAGHIGRTDQHLVSVVVIPAR